ncbi:MAG: hypothetical protein K2G32_04465 [Oscillospiraceae bacterium]|nr:hypothetical protein [Oscillospiraceae bacterium]
MKISFKIPTIAALGGLVLCAGVLSASVNGVASADKMAVDTLYENEKPFEHSVGVVENNGLPDRNYSHHIENPVVLTENSGTVGVTETVDTERTVIEHNGGYWYFDDMPDTHYYSDEDHRCEGVAIDKDGNIISVTPNADPTGSYNEESPYEAPDFSTAGVYRGDGRVYPCN